MHTHAGPASGPARKRRFVGSVPLAVFAVVIGIGRCQDRMGIVKRDAWRALPRWTPVQVPGAWCRLSCPAVTGVAASLLVISPEESVYTNRIEALAWSLALWSVELLLT